MKRTNSPKKNTRRTRREILLSAEFSGMPDIWTEHLCLERHTNGSITLSSRGRAVLAEVRQYRDDDDEGEGEFHLPKYIDGERVWGADCEYVFGTELVPHNDDAEVTVAAGDTESAANWLSEYGWTAKPGYQEVWARIKDALIFAPALKALKRGGRAVRSADADEVFESVGLPDEGDPWVGLIATQGVYFKGSIDDIDGESDDPEDYLVPSAPNFFARVGKKRTREIFDGAELSATERILFRAERAFHELSDWGGTDVRVYRLESHAGEVIYGVIRCSGGGYAYEEERGPLFVDLAALDKWARKLPNFFGWFPCFGATLRRLIALSRNPAAYPPRDRTRR